MISESYQQVIDQRDSLERRAKTEICLAGHNLVVAYIDGDYVLRCKCGVRPETIIRARRSLYTEFRKGQLTGSIERMALEKQLIARIRSGKADGKDTSKLEADLERLQNVMLGKTEEEMTTAMTVKEWTPSQLETIRKSLVADTETHRITDAEFQLFLAVCRRTGLDPFARQIYAIKYGGANPKMAIITGIDGYRLIAQRTESYAGSDEPEFGTPIGGYPEWAKVTVHKIVQGVRVPFVGVARWSEFAKDVKTPEGQQWRKMPFNMLAKCAEAQAIRKGFAIETMELEFAPETLPTPSGQVQKQTGEIIEGEARPVHDNAIPELDHLDICPVHGEDFYKRGKMPAPGHHLTDGTICNRPKVIATMLQEAREAAGITVEDFMAWTKATYQVAPSGLTDEQRCWAINYCRKASEPTEAVDAMTDPDADNSESQLPYL